MFLFSVAAIYPRCRRRRLAASIQPLHSLRGCRRRSQVSRLFGRRAVYARSYRYTTIVVLPMNHKNGQLKLSKTFCYPVQNELGAVLSLYLTYIHISRKVVPPPTLKPERIERRPAPAAPVLSIPADATVVAAISTAEIPIHSQEVSGQALPSYLLS